jgi:hypothetical protein
MYCWKCGAEIRAGQNVCTACYAPVGGQGLLSRLASWLRRLVARPVGIALSSTSLSADVLRKVQKITIADPTTGEKRVYDSLEDVPPEIRARIEALRSEIGAQDATVRQTFTFKDASGQMHTYHSVEEMPPEMRAIYERLRKEHGLDA